MNNEQLFWLAIIAILNIAAYLVGRHDGTRKEYQTTITLLSAVAPEEMVIIKEKMNKIDPVKFALEWVKKERAEGK